MKVAQAGRGEVRYANQAFSGFLVYLLLLYSSPLSLETTRAAHQVTLEHFHQDSPLYRVDSEVCEQGLVKE